MIVPTKLEFCRTISVQSAPNMRDSPKFASMKTALWATVPVREAVLKFAALPCA